MVSPRGPINRHRITNNLCMCYTFRSLGPFLRKRSDGRLSKKGFGGVTGIPDESVRLTHRPPCRGD